MLTEQEFNAAAEQHLNMVYRIALNAMKTPADAEDAAGQLLRKDDGTFYITWKNT